MTEKERQAWELNSKKSAPKKALIGEMCDGWQIQLDGKKFSWDHNDPEFTPPLVKLLEHLGYEVEVEDWY